MRESGALGPSVLRLIESRFVDAGSLRSAVAGAGDLRQGAIDEFGAHGAEGTGDGLSPDIKKGVGYLAIADPFCE
jgi:hypothetical protein